MKTWLVNMVWDALHLVAWRLHDWFFDAERAAAARMRDRERWWSYHCKAQATPCPKDDVRAKWFEARFGFKTPPEVAKARGDLTPGDVAQWDGPAADRARP